MAQVDIQLTRVSNGRVRRAPTSTTGSSIQKLLNLVVICTGPLLLTGCPARSHHPKEPAAVFLKETLAHYATLPSYAIDCDWTATDGIDTFTAKRAISYLAPGRYNVRDVHDNTLVLASVSDGAQVVLAARAERLDLRERGEPADNTISARVQSRVYVGSTYEYLLETADGPLRADAPREIATPEVEVYLPPEALVVLPV